MRNYVPHAIIVFCATFVWYATTHENNVVINFLIVVFICCLFAYFNYSDITKKKAWVGDYKTITVFEEIETEPIIIDISEEEKASNKSLRASYRELTRHNDLRMQIERIKSEKPEIERIEGAQEWVIASVQDSAAPPQGFEEVTTEKGQSYYRKIVKRSDTSIVFKLGDISENRY
jgi:hypothetical protein